MMFGLICQCVVVTTQSGKTAKTYDMKDLLSKYINDTPVAMCAFGIDMNFFKYPNNDFFLLGKESFHFDGWLVFKFLMQRNFPRLAKLFKLRIFAQK